MTQLLLPTGLTGAALHRTHACTLLVCPSLPPFLSSAPLPPASSPHHLAPIYHPSPPATHAPTRCVWSRHLARPPARHQALVPHQHETAAVALEVGLQGRRHILRALQQRQRLGIVTVVQGGAGRRLPPMHRPEAALPLRRLLPPTALAPVPGDGGGGQGKLVCSGAVVGVVGVMGREGGGREGEAAGL